MIAQKRAIDKQLYHIEDLIISRGASLSNSSVRPLIRSSEVDVIIKPVETTSQTRQQRVRGVLAIARRVVREISGPFDKNELLELIKRDEQFANKNILASNLRSALRVLTQDGVIKVESEATSTQRARYIRSVEELE